MSRTVDWSSTPGTTAAKGVDTSSKPAAVKPISAMRPASWSGETWPVSTSPAPTVATVRGGPRKSSQSCPAPSTGNSSGPARAVRMPSGARVTLAAAPPGDAEQLEGERRDQPVADANGDRQAAVDPVRIGSEVDVARARRRRHERRDRQVRAGRLRGTRNAGEARAGDGEHGQLGQPGRRPGQLGRRCAAELVEMRQHHVAAALQGGGEPHVVVQLASDHVAERRGGPLRICIERGLQLSPIDRRDRLVEDHVEADGGDPGGVQPIDQLCQPRPRPGPAAESCEAGLVDGDDHDPIARRDAPADQVAEVEKLAIENLEWNGRHQPHCRDRDRNRRCRPP